MTEQKKKTGLELVREKLRSAPHPKSRCLTKAELSLLPAEEVSRILRAEAKRERRCSKKGRGK